MAEEFKKTDLEILISTMNRSDLNFLVEMFSFGNFSDFNILIVNQTTAKDILTSDIPNVRVINFFEKGLSKSRNLALQNANGKITLIADDDVQYIKDFDQKIIDAYNQNSTATIISFQTKTLENVLVRNYIKNDFWLRERDFASVLSIEITFKIQDLKNKNIIFNEYFGLGAKFQDAESLYFLRRAKYAKLKILFVPKDIVIHDKISSSDEVTSDRWLYAKAAGYHKRFSYFSYILLFKVIFFLFRKGFISFTQITAKLKVGFKGIEDYKSLLKNKLENKYD